VPVEEIGESSFAAALRTADSRACNCGGWSLRLAYPHLAPIAEFCLESQILTESVLKFGKRAKIRKSSKINWWRDSWFVNINAHVQHGRAPIIPQDLEEIVD
jgi:hypothetical protein